MRRLAVLIAALFALAGPAAAQPQRGTLVLAAASLQESLTAVADRWARRGHPRPVLSFAASSALARQAAAGAPADLFFSADSEWVDWLAARRLLAPGTRANVLGNRLVVVALADRARAVPLRALGATLARGPVAMADPDAVPAGRYGKAALTKIGAWPAVAPRVVRAENVRAALALVERGAAPYGIVYATDAQASRSVRVVATFPAASHPRIVYPLARLARSRSAEAEAFRRYVLGREARAIFARYGFTAP